MSDYNMHVQAWQGKIVFFFLVIKCFIIINKGFFISLRQLIIHELNSYFTALFHMNKAEYPINLSIGGNFLTLKKLKIR